MVALSGWTRRTGSVGATATSKGGGELLYSLEQRKFQHSEGLRNATVLPLDRMRHLEELEYLHTPLLRIDLQEHKDGQVAHFVPMQTAPILPGVVPATSWIELVSTQEAGHFDSTGAALPPWWTSRPGNHARPTHSTYSTAAPGLVLVVTVGDVPVEPIAV